MDKLDPIAKTDAVVLRGGGAAECGHIIGVYSAVCIGPDGKVKWEAEAPNTVCTAGKNLALDTFLAGSGYTVTGPYLGLISSVGYSATAAADTMSSHAGWNEAGNGSNYPLWSTPASNARASTSWSSAAAGAKALSSAASFVIATTGGTVKGCFIVFGSGAVATNNNTSGTLLSAGVFTGGDKVVGVGDTLNVSYSLTF